NPPGLGVNWSCPMDIGIRGANIALAFRLFCFNGGMNTSWARFVVRLVQHHVNFCRSSIRKASGNNHVLAELASLYVMCALLPEIHESKQVRESAMKSLKRQLDRQIQRDGTHSDRSVYYHLYCL